MNKLLSFVIATLMTTGSYAELNLAHAGKTERIESGKKVQTRKKEKEKENPRNNLGTLVVLPDEVLDGMIETLGIKNLATFSETSRYVKGLTQRYISAHPDHPQKVAEFLEENQEAIAKHKALNDCLFGLLGENDTQISPEKAILMRNIARLMQKEIPLDKIETVVRFMALTPAHGYKDGHKTKELLRFNNIIIEFIDKIIDFDKKIVSDPYQAPEMDPLRTLFFRTFPLGGSVCEENVKFICQNIDSLFTPDMDNGDRTEIFKIIIDCQESAQLIFQNASSWFTPQMNGDARLLKIAKFEVERRHIHSKIKETQARWDSEIEAIERDRLEAIEAPRKAVHSKIKETQARWDSEIEAIERDRLEAIEAKLKASMSLSRRAKCTIS